MSPTPQILAHTGANGTTKMPDETARRNSSTSRRTPSQNPGGKHTHGTTKTPDTNRNETPRHHHRRPSPTLASNAPNTLGLANKLQILVVSRFHDVLFPSLAESLPLVVALAPPPSLVLGLVLVAHHETVEAVLVILVLKGNNSNKKRGDGYKNTPLYNMSVQKSERTGCLTHPRRPPRNRQGGMVLVVSSF